MNPNGDQIENKGKNQIASWKQESWGMCEAMANNGWTLRVTMVWLNGNAYGPKCLKKQRETPLKTGEQQKRRLSPRGGCHKGRRWPSEIIIEPGEGPRFPSKKMENGKGAWKQKEGVIKSKKQTGWDTVDHWHAQDGDLLSNDGLEKTKKDLITIGTCVTP